LEGIPTQIAPSPRPPTTTSSERPLFSDILADVTPGALCRLSIRVTCIVARHLHNSRWIKLPTMTWVKFELCCNHERLDRMDPGQICSRSRVRPIRINCTVCSSIAARPDCVHLCIGEPRRCHMTCPRRTIGFPLRSFDAQARSVIGCFRQATLPRSATVGRSTMHFDYVFSRFSSPPSFHFPPAIVLCLQYTCAARVRSTDGTVHFALPLNPRCRVMRTSPFRHLQGKHRSGLTRRCHRLA
jgi:hypothetical protein